MTGFPLWAVILSAVVAGAFVGVHITCLCVIRPPRPDQKVGFTRLATVLLTIVFIVRVFPFAMVAFLALALNAALRGEWALAVAFALLIGEPVHARWQVRLWWPEEAVNGLTAWVDAAEKAKQAKKDSGWKMSGHQEKVLLPTERNEAVLMVCIWDAIAEWLEEECDLPDFYFGVRPNFQLDKPMTEFPVLVGFSCIDCIRPFEPGDRGFIEAKQGMTVPGFVHFTCYMWGEFRSPSFLRMLVRCIDGPDLTIPNDRDIPADSAAIIEYLNACLATAGRGAL